MKILFFIDSLGSGGAQRQVVTLAQLLKEKDFEVSVLCYDKEDFFASELEASNIPIYWLLENNPLKRILNIRKFIRKGNYGAVLSFLDVPNFINCLAAIGGKSWKVITNERSANESFFKSFKGKIFAWFQRFADELVCNSFNSKQMWCKYFPLYENKITVIYNAKTLKYVNSTYSPKRDNKLNIVVAASYQYLKNPIGLVKAIRLMLPEQQKKIKVNWYGEKNVTLGGTKAYEEAITLRNEYNLKETIAFNGPTKDIIQKMANADIVALFSELEGLPNTILEGMCLGKPIIMSKVSDFNNLVTADNGFLCDWNKPETIRNALVLSLNLSEQKLIEMGRYSKIKADQLFSEEVITNEWIKVIKKYS